MNNFHVTDAFGFLSIPAPGHRPGLLGRRIRAGAGILALAVLTFPAWAGETVAVTGEGKVTPGRLVVDDREMQSSFENEMGALIDKEAYTKFPELEKQMARQTCELSLPAARTDRLTPAEVYEKCCSATVLISTFFHCGDPLCKHWHSNIASGFLVSSNGVVVSNHHIVGAAQPGSEAVGVMTLEGRVYAVGAVLASNPDSDVAFYKLATDREDFPVVPLGENVPVGNDVSLISHPDNRYYYLTRGCVSRYSLNDGSMPLCMSITADFGKGSSGGPVFDGAGNVVGMVVSTRSLAFAELRVVLDATNSSLRRATRQEIHNAWKLDPERRPYTVGFDHQMTFKDCAPVSSIRELVVP